MKKAPKAKIGDIIIFRTPNGIFNGKTVKAKQGQVTLAMFFEVEGWIYFCNNQETPANIILESDILAVNANKMGFEAFYESVVPDNVVP